MAAPALATPFMNPSTMKIYEYAIEEYNFLKIIADYLKVDDLTCLETDVSSAAGAQHSLYKNMEQATLYKRLYDGLNGATGQQFYQTYERFIQKVVRAQFSEPIYYQKKPTHRILFLNNPGESRFHRDRDYGHSKAEINYLVPQTPAYDTNTFWLESEEGKEDFRPVNMQIGEFVRFNGASLKHGAKVNTTGKSRVSFDFRVIPSSKAPASFTNTSAWKEEDKDNPLFKNAHNFVLCD